jgi:phosphotransferase system IIB component
MYGEKKGVGKSGGHKQVIIIFGVDWENLKKWIERYMSC